jgi:ATP:ADP antiporter, AAA family
MYSAVKGAMEKFLSQAFRLKPGEVSLVFLLGTISLSNALAQKVSEIASISNFLNDVGPPQFLIVLAVSSIVSFLTTGLQSLLVDRFDRITLLRGISFSLAAAFVILRVLFLFQAPRWFNYGFLYLLSEQQFIFFPMAFWVLSNDIFDISQTKRLFPLLASCNFFGSLLGIGTTAISPLLFDQFNIKAEELLMINIMLYLFIHFLLDAGLKNTKVRQARQKPETMQETLSEGLDFVKEVPAFRYLTLSFLAIIICESIVEYHFYAISESVFHNADSYQTFYSLFTLFRFLALILVQVFLTQRIFSTINLKYIFFILPVSGLLGLLCMTFFPGLWGGGIGFTLQKIPQYGIDETARKSFQGLVPEERRGRVSLFMDGYLNAAGILIGTCITGTIVYAGIALNISNYFYGYLAIAVLVCLFALWTIFKMCSVYDRSLLNWRLKRRQRGKSVLDKLDF